MMLAPKLSTIPCTTDNPKPVPTPTDRVVKNGSNMRSAVVGSMPWPVSLTHISTRAPVSPGGGELP